MDLGSAGMSTSQHNKSPDIITHPDTDPGADYSSNESSSRLSASGISMWAKSLKIPQPFSSTQEESSPGNSGKSALARFTSGIGLRLSPKSHQTDNDSDGASTTTQSGFIGSITKGLVDSSKNAVKAVQVKARHVVSQNKRRYQEGGFDLDLTYITENIIAMGFPAGDMSSGIFGYVEGFYRNHMEEVINFLETHHKEKYKVYNLCSERLYDASLFEGKVASFPFDDHNCPPIQLIISFCKSAYSWLKEDIENVVVVHCKAGMARTGLMISSLLLYLKFFPTAEESMDYYNQKRCIDGKGLVLPSQIRYVKYFERTFTYFNGENQPGRRCLLRGFRLHRCPYWVRPSITVSDHNGVLFSTKKHPRTKDFSSEDIWYSAPKKGVMVFALPGEPGIAELAGDFKIHFHDRQGDFYCWLNTTMIENRKLLSTNDLDGFDKRKLPSPGFQVEVVLLDLSPPTMIIPDEEPDSEEPVESSGATPVPVSGETKVSNKDDVFSDDESGSSKDRKSEEEEAAAAAAAPPKVGGGSALVEVSKTQLPVDSTKAIKVEDLTRQTSQISTIEVGNAGSTENHPNSSNTKDGGSSITQSSSAGGPEETYDFKAMAADASVFTFGDEEDDEDLL